MEKKYITTIDNKRIFDFYNANPNINIVSMNIILLNFIEQVGTDMSKVFMDTKLGEINDNLKEIKLTMNNLNDDLTCKINEYNKNFIDTFKLVIANSNSENNDKIVSLINQNTELFVQKISLTMPKTQEENNKKLQEILTQFQKTVTDDIKMFMMTTHSDSSLKTFISTLDSKIQIMQQPIYNILSSTQEHLDKRLSLMREENGINKAHSEKIFNELTDFLGKYKNSSQFKGQVSENMLGDMLTKLYPTAEVINTTSVTAAGDFLLRRENKPNIIFENKCYDKNVNIDEIKKFIRDVTERKTCGIMISQQSGIVGRPDYHIEIHDGKVLIYLHNVNHSPEKVKMAIDIIDNLYEKLQIILKNEHNQGVVINKDVLDVINDQFQFFLSQKELLLNAAREFQKKIINQIDELKLPELSNYLNGKYASIQNQQFTCDMCGQSFSNNRSLGSHKKLHKGNKPIGNQIVINT
jgi:hypothetical protein